MINSYDGYFVSVVTFLHGIVGPEVALIQSKKFSIYTGWFKVNVDILLSRDLDEFTFKKLQAFVKVMVLKENYTKACKGYNKSNSISIDGTHLE